MEQTCHREEMDNQLSTARESPRARRAVGAQALRLSLHMDELTKHSAGPTAGAQRLSSCEIEPCAIYKHSPSMQVKYNNCHK